MTRARVLFSLILVCNLPMRKSRVFALGVIGVVAVRLLSEVPSQLRAQHDARRRRAARAGAEGAAEASSLLMYDGVCNLCNGFVNWVADNDSERNVKFAAQQQHMDMLERLGAPTDLSTLILVEGDEFYLYSSAALRTMALMDQPYRSLSAAYAIPEVVRDFVYKLVARNRYWIFGKSEKCRAPSADFRSRFLGYDALADEENDFAQDVLKKSGKASSTGDASSETTSAQEL